MARLLRQSTAHTFRAGPFLDSTDASAETGQTIAQGDIQLSKAGGAFAQTSEASPTTTHDADGFYQCPLTATDTNTLGHLRVQISLSGVLPVIEDFVVVSANVYDSLVAGSDYLQADAVQVEGGDATDALAAAVADLATQASVDTIDGIVDAILLDTAEIGAAGAGLTGLGDTRLANLDASVATRATVSDVADALSTAHGAGAWDTAAPSAGDVASAVWSAVTRTLTAGTNLNNLSASDVLTQVLAALDTAIGASPTAGSVNERVKTIDDAYTAARAALLDRLDATVTSRAATGEAATAVGTLHDFDPATETVTVGTNNDKTGYSLAADQAVNVTKVGGTGVTGPSDLKADVSALATAANLATVNTVVDAIKAKTDNLPAAPAATSDIPSAASIKTALEADGSKLDHLWETTEDDSGTRRFTTNALEQAPSGGASLTQQQVRDALKLAPSAGDPAAGSIDAELDALATAVDAVPTAAEVDTALTASHGAGLWSSSAGSGANTVTLTIDDGTDPVVGVNVVIKNAAETATVAGPQTTDSDGQVVFNLDDGTYHAIVVSTPAYDTLAAQTLTVSGTTTDTYSLTAFDAGSPTEPSQCRVYDWLYNAAGTAQASVAITFTPVTRDPSDIAHGSDTLTLRDVAVTATTDSEGYFTADLYRSSEIGNRRYWVEVGEKKWQIEVPDAASATLASLFSA